MLIRYISRTASVVFILGCCLSTFLNSAWAQSPADTGQSVARTDSTAHVAVEDGGRNFFGDIAYGAQAFASDALHIYSSPPRLNKKSALWLGGIIAAGGLIYAYDQEILDMFQRNREEFPVRPLHELGDYFYELGNGGTIAKYYIGGLVVGYVSGVEPFRAIAFDLFESYYIAGSVKNLLNRGIGRKRPFEAGPRSFKFDDGTSLPSGHTTNIVMSAAIVSKHIDFLPLQISAYTVATGVSVERLTSNSHWPSDVYVGAVYGWFLARAIIDRNEARRAEWSKPTLSFAPYSDSRAFGLGMLVRW